MSFSEVDHDCAMNQQSEQEVIVIQLMRSFVNDRL